MSRDSASRRILLREILLLLCFCAFLFFYGLGSFGLVGADEPRYAQVAREMLARHDWITPTLGGQPWLEKPALYYWQAMLSYTIFGGSDWAARIPSAVDASLLVFAIYFFLRRFRSGFALDGALMTASSAAVIGFGRAASTDMPLAAMFGIALLAWYAWQQNARNIYLAAFYVFLGLGTLAKGPVAPFLAVSVIAIYALSKGDYTLIPRTLWIPGILLFGVVVLPWYVAVQLRNPEFFQVFIVEHNLARFGTNLYRHKEPFWYYAPIAMLSLAPWTILWGAAFIETLRLWIREKRTLLQSEGAWNVFLIIWLLVPIVFFSLSQSKLPGYILPAIPAGTLLLADYVRQRLKGDIPLRNTALLAFHSVLAALPVAPALMVTYIVQQHRMPWNIATAVSFAIATALAIGITLTLRGHLGLRGLRVTLLPVALAVAAILRIGSPALDNALSARPLNAAIGHPSLAVAIYRAPRELEYGLGFYRDAVIDRYESGQIPSSEHILIAPTGSMPAIQNLVPSRRVILVGNFAPQNLDYFWVGP
ncbi:MAG: glycosyltransferase family 39 protein [Terriglobales bacterium]